MATICENLMWMFITIRIKKDVTLTKNLWCKRLIIGKDAILKTNNYLINARKGITGMEGIINL